MWILEILNEKENLQTVQSYRLNNECVSIGRSVDGDIVFPSDRSISRKHAEIRISTSGIFLVDLKSTLGTFLDGARIKPNEMISLISGNIIKFGNEHTITRIVNLHYKFCPTRLEKPEKEKLKSLVGTIGAEIAKQVETCTHVLCNRFSATVKTLTAIVLQKPIVSFHWIESFATSSSNSVLIPDVKEFCPPGASELTSVEKLHLPRSELLSDCAVFFLFPNDSQYELILERCGARIIPMFGIDSIDELVRTSKELLSKLSERRSSPCVFYDEGRPLDTKTIHLMKRMSIPFLGSGELATAIFTLSPPQFVTHELLSQRVSSQQSQIQASQTVDVPLSRSTEPHKSEISRSVTLVQTERIDLLPDDKLKSEHVDDQISAIEKARKRELERQAEEREKKQREREEFEQKEKEKIEQRVRRTELQKLENDRKVKEKQNRHDQEEHERANKAKQESTNSISSMVSRSKRSADVLLDENVTHQPSPAKRRRPEVISTPAPQLLFEDQPLIKMETPSDTRSFPKQSKTVVDQQGWVSIDKTNTGANCIEMSPSVAMAPAIQIPRRVINFDDPNPSQSKINDSQSIDYPQAVVIEMNFRMKADDTSRNPPIVSNRHPRDKRNFKKNVVRTLQIDQATSTANQILRKRDMDKVLPKESERELLLNQSYETERRAIENRETLFSDSLTGNKTRKPRFGN